VEIVEEAIIIGIIGIMDKMVAYFKSILSSGQNGCNIFEQFLRYIFIVSIFVLSS